MTIIPFKMTVAHSNSVNDFKTKLLLQVKYPYNDYN